MYDLGSAKRRFFILAMLLILLTGGVLVLFSQSSVTENLDEMVARKARYAGASWGPQYLEDASNNYIWQPETLCYTDQSTGHEVWILTHAPDLSEYFSKEHASNAWSFDGSKIGFFSLSRTTLDPNIHTTWHYRWVVNTDGSCLRVCEGYGRYSIPFEGFGWAHTENAYYSFGSGPWDATSDSTGAKLYKDSLDSANNVTARLVLDTTAIDSDTKEPVKDGISGDDLWVAARDLTTHTTADPNPIATTEMYFISLSGVPRVMLHWGIARGIPAYNGHNEADETKWHDVWAPGPSQTWIMGQYAGDGSAILVTMNRSGSASDGGPLWTNWNGSSFGEIRVESDGGTILPHDPYNIPYFGHPAFDRWGQYAIVGTYTDPQSDAGARLWNAATHSLLPNYMMKGTYDGQHHSWTGWTDHLVMCSPEIDLLYGNTYQGNETTRYPIAALHYPGYSGNYNGYPRPSQSPDGTKVAFHALWLNNGGDSYPYLSWAVVYYPKPPVNVSASMSGSSIRLSWKAPSYTSRGWPNATDPVPAAREIKGYHVWRSSTGTGGWAELTSSAIVGTTYTDSTVSTGSTYYYALTSEEYSRLESHELSQVLKCTIDATSGALTATVFQDGGQKNFWSVPPLAPNNVTVKQGTAPGQYRLQWSVPAWSSKIRYYNVYYSSSAVPPTDPQHRIASIPIGISTYLDWNADPARPAFYKITSVDRLGNESVLGAPAAPTGLKIK